MKYFNLFLQSTFLMCGLLGLFGRLEIEFWYPIFALWVAIDAAVDTFIATKEITHG